MMDEAAKVMRKTLAAAVMPALPRHPDARSEGSLVTVRKPQMSLEPAVPPRGDDMTGE